MKKILIISGMIAAFLCLTQNANAQYAGPIHREGANLADMRGNILTDHEVLNLIGEQVYDETYVGACKQRKAGKTLIWSGLGGMVGGAVLYGRSTRTAPKRKSREPSRPLPARPA